MIPPATSCHTIRPVRIGPFTDLERRRNPGAPLCEMLPNNYSFYIKPHKENTNPLRKCLLNSFLRLCEFCQITHSTRQIHIMNQFISSWEQHSNPDSNSIEFDGNPHQRLKPETVKLQCMRERFFVDHIIKIMIHKTFCRSQVIHKSQRIGPLVQLFEDGVGSMVSQSAIPSRQHFKGYLPFAFTEEGVASPTCPILH